MNGNGLEVCISVNFHHLAVGFHLDVRSLLDLVDQILRHGCGKRWATDQHHHLPRVFRKVHCGLTSGVCASDNVNVLALTLLRLGHRRAIIDAASLQPVSARHVQLPVGNSRRDQQRFAANIGSRRKLDDLRGAFHS